MIEALIHAANIICPPDDSGIVISVGTSSGETNLSTDLPDVESGRILTLFSDGDVWLNFGAGSGGSVSSTATSGSTRATCYLAAGGRLDCKVVDGRKYLRHIGGSATYLRGYLSSRMPTDTA